MIGCPNPKSCTRGRQNGLPSNIQGGSRMRESRTYGSVRGALINGRPYRDRLLLHSTSVVQAQDVERRAAQFVNPSGTGLVQRNARAVKRWSLPVGESY